MAFLNSPHYTNKSAAAFQSPDSFIHSASSLNNIFISIFGAAISYGYGITAYPLLVPVLPCDVGALTPVPVLPPDVTALNATSPFFAKFFASSQRFNSLNS